MDSKGRSPIRCTCANESFLARHWIVIVQRMNREPKAGVFASISLQMRLDAHAQECSSDVEELSTAAAKQHSVKRVMASMKKDWALLAVGTKERNFVPSLRGTDGIQPMPVARFSKPQATRSSPFSKPYKFGVHAREATPLYMQDFVGQATSLLRCGWP